MRTRDMQSWMLPAMLVLFGINWLVFGSVFPQGSFQFDALLLTGIVAIVIGVYSLVPAKPDQN
jgi:hypothetical protein